VSNKLIWISIVGLLIIALAIQYKKDLPELYPPYKGNNTICTMDAMECPDGSFVGRGGPKCEFAPCPTPPTQ